MHCCVIMLLRAMVERPRGRCQKFGDEILPLVRRGLKSLIVQSTGAVQGGDCDRQVSGPLLIFSSDFQLSDF